jgi:hypothetical protein
LVETIDLPDGTRLRRRLRIPAPLTLAIIALVAGLALTIAIICARAWQREALIGRIEAVGGEVYREPELPLWVQQRLHAWFGEEFAERFLSISGVSFHERPLLASQRRELLSAIGTHESITYLALSRTGLDDDDLPALEQLARTRILSLEGNPLTDRNLHVFGGMPALEDVLLHETQVTGSGFAALGRLPGLRQIYVNDTPFGDEGLRHVGSIPTLQHLIMPGTRVTDAGIRHLGGLTDIRRIDLRETSVTDEALPALARLTTLEELYLSHTRATGAGLPALRPLVNLQRLSLAANAVSDDVFAALEELPALAYVDLRETEVTVDGVDRFRSARPQCEVELLGTPRRWR